VRSLVAAVERLAAGGAVTLSRAPEGYDAFVVAALARGLAGAGETRGAALTAANDALACLQIETA